MTSKPRKPAASAPADTAKDEQPTAAPDQATSSTEQPTPAEHDAEGGAPELETGESLLHTDGEPQPETVDRSMVRPETGVSPAAFRDGDPVPTAAYGDDERNGKAAGIPTDTSGKLRHVEGATPTAAHGRTARNGEATEMIEAQTSREFGGNGDSVAKLQNGGVRAEIGAGTGTPAPADERPTYPSSTLTRESPEAAPSEPGDVRHATEPRRGDPKTSTDPIMATAAMPSMPGDVAVKLVNRAGEEVKPSEFFEVIDGPRGRIMRRVTMRVSEVHTVRQTRTPGKRLLFAEGQEVPADVAEALIDLHG